MIGADWESRRLRNIESQLWQRELAQGANLVDVYTSNQGLVRLERRKDATKRAYYRALKEMQRIIRAEEQAHQSIDWGDMVLPRGARHGIGFVVRRDKPA